MGAGASHPDSNVSNKNINVLHVSDLAQKTEVSYLQPSEVSIIEPIISIIDPFDTSTKKPSPKANVQKSSLKKVSSKLDSSSLSSPSNLIRPSQSPKSSSTIGNFSRASSEKNYLPLYPESSLNMDDALPISTVVNNTNKSKNIGTLKASSSTPSFDYLTSANQTNDLFTSRAISTDNLEPPPCSQELLEKSGGDCNNNSTSPGNRLNLGRPRREEEDSESFFGLGSLSSRPPPIKMTNPKLASLTNYHNSHLQRMDNDSSSTAEDRGSRLNLNSIISPISASGIGCTSILRNSNPFNIGSNSPLMNPLCRPTIPPIRSLNSGNLPLPSPHNPGSNSSKGTNENGSDRYGRQNSGWIVVPVSTTDNNNSYTNNNNSPLTSSTNLRSYTGCVLRNSNNSMNHSNSNRSSANRNNTNGGDDNSGEKSDDECGSGGVRSRSVRISGGDDRKDSIGGNDNGNGDGSGIGGDDDDSDGDVDGDDDSDEEDALEMVHHGYSPRPGMKNRLSKPRANVWTSSTAGGERGGGHARERDENEGERQMMNHEKAGSVSIGNMSVQSFKLAGDEDEDEDDDEAGGGAGWGGERKKVGEVQVQLSKGQSEEVEGRDKYPSNALSSGSLQDPNSSILMKFSSAYSCASLETIESAANPNSGDSRLLAEDEAMRVGRRTGGHAGERR